LTVTATPDTGFEFMFWIITVEDASHLVTDNPLQFSIETGIDYEIQPVFTTEGGEIAGAGTVPSTIFYAVTSVLAVIIIIAFSMVIVYAKRAGR
jgi:hypothetical protein